MADPITIQARLATPEEKAEAPGIEEPLFFDALPALDDGYEFGYQSPFINNLERSDRYDNRQKREILDEFQRGYDSFNIIRDVETGLIVGREEGRENLINVMEFSPILDTAQKQEVIKQIDESFDSDRPLLTERFAENFKNAWLGIEEIPTSAGALFRSAEMGTGLKIAAFLEMQRLQNMQRELDIREGRLNNVYDNPVYTEWPTPFLRQQINELEAKIPILDEKAKQADFDGIMVQAFRAGRFSALPGWEGFREGTAALLGYLLGASLTGEAAIPVFGAAPGTPFLKAAAIRFVKAALFSGTASLTAEPLIQDVAALNFVQEGYHLGAGATRAFLAMFLDGTFNAVGDLGGRFFKKFGVEPTELRGLPIDDTVEILIERTGKTRQEILVDMSGVYVDYAEDVVAKLPDTEIRITRDSTDAIGRPPPDDVPKFEIILDDAPERKLQFLETLKESPRTDARLKQDPFDKLLTESYSQLSDKKTLKIAQERIDELGEADAISEVLSVTHGDPITYAMGMDLIRRLQNRKEFKRIPDIAKAIARSAKSQGQAIQVLSMWNRMSPEGVLVVAQSKLDELKKLYPKRNIPESLTNQQQKELTRLAKDSLSAKTDTEKLYRAAVQDMALNSMTGEVDMMTKLRTVRIISMLANPKTIIRNIGGNQFLFFANMANDYLDVPVDISVSFLRAGWTGADPRIYRTKTIPSFTEKVKGLIKPLDEFAEGRRILFPDEVKGGFYGGLAAQKQALDNALEYVAVLGKLTSQNKFEMQAVKDINRWVFEDATAQNLEKAIAITLGIPDRAFWWSAFRSSIDNQMRVFEINTGVSIGSPTNKMIERAYLDGATAIFQDENAFSKWAHKARKLLNISEKVKFGPGDVLIPFAQIPATLAARGLEYSPAGYLKALYKVYQSIPGDMFPSQKFDQRIFVEAISRATTGTVGLVGMGYWLAKEGIITSTLDEDPDVKAYQRTMGMNAYRLNASALKRKMLTFFHGGQDQGVEGDTIVSYDWAQPLSMPLAMGAELFYAKEREERQKLKKPSETTADWIKAFAAGASTLREMSFLQSLNSFGETLFTRNLWEATKQAMIRDLPASFVPTFVNQLEQLQNNIVRDTRGPDEFETSYLRVANRIPNIVEEMGYPAQREVWGEVIRRFPDVEQKSWFNIFLNPALVSKLHKDPVGEELLRLYDATGESTQFPRKAPFSLEINKEEKILTPDERSQYQQWTGRLTRDLFHNWIMSPFWAKLPDRKKIDLLSKWISNIGTAGKIELFGHRPEKITGGVAAMIGKGRKEKEAGVLIDEENPKD